MPDPAEQNDKDCMFVVQDDDDDDDDDDGANEDGLNRDRSSRRKEERLEEQRSGAAGAEAATSRPTLLDRQATKSPATAELDLLTPPSSTTAIADTSTADTDSTATTSSTPYNSARRSINPHHPSPSSTPFNPTSSVGVSRKGDGQTRQYFLRKTDTLASISIRFGISTNELCLLNAIPRASPPHLLHTRSFILIPAWAVEKQLAANPALASSLQGPPKRTAGEKTTSARREAEAKFRAILSKGANVAAAAAAIGNGETLADEKAARAYIGLAEDEFRCVDFGEGSDDVGLPVAYDRDHDQEAGRVAEKTTKKGATESEVEVERREMLEAQRDTARRLRFEAILKHALAKWEMDSDWERAQRSNGIDPSTVSESFPSSASTSTAADGEKEKRRASTGIGGMGSWFSRALHANSSGTAAGEPSSSSSPSSSSFSDSRSKPPRHVVSLSSTVKLPTHLSHTLSNAHKGPINVARYNTTGRYILTGGADRSIRLWNAKSGGDAEEAIKCYTEHKHEVLALDVSHDNSRFVSGGADKSVYVWDVATGSVIRRFNGWLGKTNDVRFGGKDADGSVVVTGGLDGIVRVFDLRAQGEWRPIMQLKDATDAVTSLTVKEDRIYSGSVDGTLRCYDLRAGQLRSDTFAAPITSVYPSKLGTSVLVATLDNTIRLLDAKDGTMLQEYRGHAHGEYRCRAMLTADEDGVIAGDENGDLIGWDTVSAERVAVGAKQGKEHAKPILWVEPSPDPNAAGEFVSAGADGVVKIWSMS